jgi:thiol-disulfide isomerase/thioredoxin
MGHWFSLHPAALRGRRLLIGSALGLAIAAIVPPLMAVAVAADDAPWPLATDLAADGTTAKATGKPILFYFERRDCPYCRRAAPYLRALEQSHGDRALLRRIETDRADLPVRDFAGAVTNHAALAQLLKGTLTPSVLAVGPQGQPLVAPLVGLPDESFYSHYLEQLLKEAADKAAALAQPVENQR